ncbi:MAG: hypothetical protein K6G33_09215 [Ruminococcus sp.]|uniref:NAD(P)/FAD-dependent oxidoreductase n=1 Tax=Ruminococcus sp. TaxID=41978 RepID=UPI0025F00479|nr:hypothetical protein [Ruminococcus sp.]MCR5600901.1 hypothetical protein [Ruminococcus sp.]
MIRVGGIKVSLDTDLADLTGLCEKKLKISRDRIKSVKLGKRSVDARKKSDVHFLISLDIEAKGEDKLLKTLKNAVKLEKTEYIVPLLGEAADRPVIVGFGPAGMFAALVLSMAGAKPIVLERGGDVDSRCKAVEEFQSGGRLDPECNVQFGEGGAGTFSDGKLTTGIKDRRIGWVFERLVEFGAPDEILWLAKPHIGTDKLRGAVKSLRERVISLGGEVRFNSKFCGFEAENGSLTAVRYEHGGKTETIDTNSLILASGHSARDVFELLYKENIALSQKNFSVGVRAEHLRSDIDKAMYGDFAGHPALKAADYKLAVHLPNGRTLYTFCMCPGGYVVAASSEEGRLAVNGMSCFARDAENSNSALLVNVGTEDYGSDHPLAGMYFQRELEEKAFKAGGCDYRAPAAVLRDFMEGRVSDKLGRVKPSYRPSVKFAAPEEYLPDFVCESLKLGIKEMGKKIKGFDDGDTLLTGIESRSSSPVRINRGEDMQSLSLKGLFPCGEGAGYAGGIVSAAVDGMKCAEAVCERIEGQRKN